MGFRQIALPLLLLFFSYFMIGLAPLFLFELKSLCSFTLTFLRFTGAWIIELIMITIMLIVLYMQMEKFYHSAPNIEKIVEHPTFLGMVKSIFRQYYSSPNPYFRNRSQIGFLFWLGFLLSTVVQTYYLSFNLLGLVITVITQSILTVLGVAVFNWIKKEESFDLLKLIYLVILGLVVFMIAFSSSTIIDTVSMELGIFVILISIISYILYIIQFGYEHSQKILLLRNLGLPREREKGIQKSSMILRALLKLFGIHFFAAWVLLPIGIFLGLLSPTTIIGTSAVQFIQNDFLHTFDFLFSTPVIGLFLVCTAIPYFLIIFSSVIWPRDAMKHSLWTGIFTTVEPIVGLYIGFFVWQEAIRTDYLIYTTILLIAAIFIRYFHESVNVRKIGFLIHMKHGTLDTLIVQLSKIKELDSINVLTGDYDLMIKITIRSMSRLAEIAEYIQSLDGVESSKYHLQSEKF